DVQRPIRAHPEPTALARSEAPVTLVRADPRPARVDHRAHRCLDAAALEERAVVVTPEETGLLALCPARSHEPGGGSLGARLLLRLLAEREGDALEQPRIDGGEHVRLVLPLVYGAGYEARAVALDDPGVMTGPDFFRSRPLGERDELVEAEHAV